MGLEYPVLRRGLPRYFRANVPDAKRCPCPFIGGVSRSGHPCLI